MREMTTVCKRILLIFIETLGFNFPFPFHFGLLSFRENISYIPVKKNKYHFVHPRINCFFFEGTPDSLFMMWWGYHSRLRATWFLKMYLLISFNLIGPSCTCMISWEYNIWVLLGFSLDPRFCDVWFTGLCLSKNGGYGSCCLTYLMVWGQVIKLCGPKARIKIWHVWAMHTFSSK